MNTFTTLRKFVPALALSIALAGSAQAFDFGGLKDKATSAIEDNGGSDLLSMGKSLYSAFEGNETATKYAKSMMAKLQTGDYGKVFDYYDKIKGAGLTDQQLSAWNDLKNKVSGFVLDQNFSFDDDTLSNLVSKASDALSGNNTASAATYLDKLKSAAGLSSEQKSLLSEIKDNLMPIVSGK